MKANCKELQKIPVILSYGLIQQHVKTLNATWIPEEITRYEGSTKPLTNTLPMLPEGTGDNIPSNTASTLHCSSLVTLLPVPAERLHQLLVALKNLGMEIWSPCTHGIVDKRAAKLERVQACCIL